MKFSLIVEREIGMGKEIKSKIPLYVDAYEEIHNMINTGVFKAGEKLPSETELSKLLKISRSTLRQALFLLREDNLIFNYQGKGNYVTNNQEVTNKGIEEKSVIAITHNTHIYDEIDFKISFQLPTTKHKNELNVDDSKLLVVLEGDYFVKEDEAAYMIMFIPYEFLNNDRVNLNEAKEVYDYILDSINKNVSNIQSKISLSSNREKISKKFNLQKEEMIIVFDEVFYLERGVPFISVKTYCVPKYFKFNINRK